MQTILIVEDDRDLRTGLEFDLGEEGYHIICTDSGQRSLDVISTNEVDLVLLDVNLPDMNGYEVCRKIKIEKDVPVIFLTACDMEQDEVNGFEQGADDYIIKPFRMVLLRKRIAAVLRRTQKNNVSERFEDDFLYIDFEQMLTVKAQKEIALTSTEYKLAKILISNRGNVLTRQLLLEKLWDYEENFVEEHALTVAVNRLRGKIEDEKHTYIKTIYGMGYTWVGANNE